MNYRAFIKFPEKWVILIVISLVTLAACSQKFRILPDEFGLSWPIYDLEVQYLFGPGGINHSFNVFELDGEIATVIEKGGLPFLENMQSSAPVEGDDGPQPFTGWRSLPVLKDDQWPRQASLLTGSDLPLAGEFFGRTQFDDGRFVDNIDPEYLAEFHDTISGTDGYYAYGGYRGKALLIVSPVNRRVYYLFRD